jgi:hypothetical protein
VLRRKRLPNHLEPVHEAFVRALEAVEEAKRAVVEAMPTSRLPGRPLPDAILEFEDHLREAAAGMDAWRAEEVEHDWERCREGVDLGLALAERVRTDPPALSFDGTAFLIQDLIAPLEPFEEAAERFRALRR